LSPASRKSGPTRKAEIRRIFDSSPVAAFRALDVLFHLVKKQ
jgi:hypothetical protein